MVLTAGPATTPFVGTAIASLHAIGSPSIIGLAGVVDQASAIQEYEEARPLIERLSAGVVILRVIAWSPTEAECPPLLNYPWAAGQRMRCCILLGHFTSGGTAARSIVLLEGTDTFVLDISTILYSVCRGVLDPSGDIAALRDAWERADQVGPVIRPAVYEFYKADAHELVDIFYDQGVSLVTKVLTAYATWMPPARLIIANACVLTPHSDTVRTAIARRGADVHPESLCMVVCAIGLLLPAFSIKENIPRQIDSRLKAACAAIGVKPPGPTQVSDVCASARWDHLDLPSGLIEVVAAVVARNTQGQIDPDVKLANLMTLDAMRTRWNLYAFQIEMITQMRIVFASYHATTIRFGIQVLSIAEPYLLKMGPAFASEVGVVQAASAHLTNCKYSGLRAKIPEGLQVKASARVCFVGLMYYEKSLVSKEEKVNFERYATQAVKHHIDPISDADVCLTLVNILPDPNIVSAIAMGEHLSFDEMNAVIERYTEAEQKIIYKMLCTKAEPGEWASMRMEVEENAFFIDYMQKGMATLDLREREMMDQYTNARIAARTADDIRVAQETMTAWMAKVTKAKKELVSVKDLLPLATEPRFRNMRNRVLKRLEKLNRVLYSEAEPAEEAEEDPAGTDEDEA